MSVQSEFLDFHDRIKLDYDVKAELRDKRDILIRILRNSGKLPGFTSFNQGSYGMFLGVEPVGDREYDIDVGLRFDVDKDDYEPTDLKNTIREILKNHTDYGTVIKKPCVTVTYKKDGEPAYHVDLVSYVYEDHTNKDSQLFLAKGKDSAPDEICWEKSDPIGLINYINNAISVDKARDQFRRVVRYLKRWKHIRFDSNGHAEPASIGITLIAADCYEESEDDLNALFGIVESIQNLFTFVRRDNSRNLYRIIYPMPSSLRFDNDTDAFIKMTDIQMTDFKDRIDKLARDLDDVKNEPDEVEQCRKLNRIFGEDFHIPEAKAVSKFQRSYIPTSSASGSYEN